MLFDKKEEIYSKKPETEEEARVQLVDIYQNIADKFTVSARKNAFCYAVLTGLGIGSVYVCRLLGIDEKIVNTVSDMVLFSNSVGGIVLLRNVLLSLKMRKRALSNKEDTLNHIINNCIERVNAALDLAADEKTGNIKL